MRISYIISGVLLSLATAAQSQARLDQLSIEDPAFEVYFKDKKNIPSVTVKIINSSSTDLSAISVAYSVVVPFDLFQVKKQAIIGQDGTFRLDLDYPFPNQEVWLRVGTYFYAGIYVNRDLTIVLDFQKLMLHPVDFIGDGVEFQGSDAGLNIIMNKFVLFRSDTSLKLVRKSGGLEREFSKRNPSPYGPILENERLSGRYANSFMEDMPDSIWKQTLAHKPLLMSNESASFYRYLYMRYQLKANGRRYWHEVSEQAILKEGDKYLMRQLIQENDKKEKGLPHDTVLVQRLSEKFWSQFGDILDLIVAKEIVHLIDEEIDRPKSDIVKLQFVGIDPFREMEVMQFLKTNVKTAWCKEIVDARYSESVRNVKKINDQIKSSRTSQAAPFGESIADLSFGARLIKVDSTDARQLLAQLRNLFPNKAIVFDFWATWCGPCIAEMPHMKELHTAVSNLKVEFVYVCSSSGTVEKWKRKVAQFEQPGTHIFLDETTTLQLMKELSLKDFGFPSHAYVDVNGKVIPNVLSGMRRMSPGELSKIIRETE